MTKYLGSILSIVLVAVLNGDVKGQVKHVTYKFIDYGMCKCAGYPDGILVLKNGNDTVYFEVVNKDRNQSITYQKLQANKVFVRKDSVLISKDYIFYIIKQDL